MKIGIYQVDGAMPNLALMKLSAFHKAQNDSVEWANPLGDYDKVFASQIFTDSQADSMENMTIGGTGVSLSVELPKEVENCLPDYTIYPNYAHSIGFLTRGCIRKCSFCVVPEKEGDMHEYRNMAEVWRGRGDVVLFDNNILAMPKKFEEALAFCKNHGIHVDFNQGLDCRLVDNAIAKLLKEHRQYIKPEIRFAFDNLSYEKSVKKTIRLLGFRCFWYVYCDENWESALERLLILKRLGQRTYLMRNERVRGSEFQKFTVLANWSNCMGAMNKMDFYDYAHYYKNRDYFKELEQDKKTLFSP